MIRPIACAIALVTALAVPALGATKAESLADLRTELDQLASALQGLRSELKAGGAGGFQAAGGAAALDRMNAMEAEISRLTSKTEELQNQINRVVSDGTNRIGDLEFRLCELEEGCDTSHLPITEKLGGGGAAAGSAGAGGTAPIETAPAGTGVATGGEDLAVNEQADFDRAKAALDSGDFRGAADLFATFGQTYPGGPLTGEAQFLRGEALSKANDTPGAARAYLDAFSSAPNGPRAAVSLLRLGAALGLLGQKQEACVTLAEVGHRFPAAPEVAEATSAMQGLSCP